MSYPLPRPTAEAVFHAHAPRVYSLALRILGNAADAEDVTQDVLLQVVRKLDTFRGESSLGTWLHRVTVHATLEHKGRRARWPEQNLGVFLDGALSPDEADGPSDRALRGDLRQHLERVIARLPEMYRNVFVLADVEELPNAEVGRRLGLSVPAVKSRLHRARRALREALGGHLAP
jgi:RNA polymerase sigma-70 factor (ECF subfamily)